ncbi:MAG: 3-dehydroquinate dehydratase [Bacteroidia bacterium]|jgi:3-dehydroquinate dehydratase-2|nr:3-dehydroquinate dehydratase [Bacteroidia bacterium]
MKVAIINGPNLNLLGKREPEVYGKQHFVDILNQIKTDFTKVDLHYFQSNIEGELIDYLQGLEGANFSGAILNAGGYSHTSIALADCVKAISTPVIGVHMSNIYAREEERHTDLLSAACKGGIYGLGAKGYEMALRSLLD